MFGFQNGYLILFSFQTGWIEENKTVLNAEYGVSYYGAFISQKNNYKFSKINSAVALRLNKSKTIHSLKVPY